MERDDMLTYTCVNITCMHMNTHTHIHNTHACMQGTHIQRHTSKIKSYLKPLFYRMGKKEPGKGNLKKQLCPSLVWSRTEGFFLHASPHISTKFKSKSSLIKSNTTKQFILTFFIQEDPRAFLF